MRRLAATAILLSVLIDASLACVRTEDIDRELQWACWDFDRTATRYTSPNKCCSGSSCECDETGNFTSNARFGRDCKCVSTTVKFVNEYYARIAARQQQDNATQDDQA
ncbi:uncharacterized protein LOC131666595 [Phymastichus coffea]|uniref:uncharacterized protein LOC131666595 n=1 Tax=Phymastichus coffea TaxID=108790 RepID=UPI00273BB1C3|nr:uncharacterized protein LOC131666595 [Phymastichus coffea]